MSWKFWKKDSKKALKKDEADVKAADSVLDKAEKTEVVLAKALIDTFDSISKLLEKGESDLQKIFELMEEGTITNSDDFEIIVADLTNELTIIENKKRQKLYSDINQFKNLCTMSLQAANTLEFILKQHGMKEDEIKEIGALEAEEKEILSDLKEFQLSANKIFEIIAEISVVEQGGLTSDSKEKAKELRRKINSLNTNLLRCDFDIKKISGVLNDTGLFLKRAHQKGIVLDVAINNVLSMIYAGKLPEAVKDEDSIIRKKILETKDGSVYHTIDNEKLLRTNQSTKMLKEELGHK